jgi:hypothetical protein
MSNDRDDIIVLIDENGEEIEVELIDSIVMDESEYVVLLPKDDYVCSDDDCECEDCEEEEVVILRVEINEDGEETFVAIEDEEEQNAVFDIFTQRIEDSEYDEFDEDDDEEEEGDDESDGEGDFGEREDNADIEKN